MHILLTNVKNNNTNYTEILYLEMRDIMKKIIVIPSFIVAALVLVVALKGVDKLTLDNTKAIVSYESTTDEIQEPLYILKEYNDSLAVFKPNYETPMRVIDSVIVSTLNDYDQLLLKSGIEVNSESELQSLIEDYDS